MPKAVTGKQLSSLIWLIPARECYCRCRHSAHPVLLLPYLPSSKERPLVSHDDRQAIPDCPIPRPQSPRLNGAVEWVNDSAKVKFWSQYAGELSVREAGHALADYQHFYNCVRPHCVQIIVNN
ncbi:MAG: transposase [Gammaproteobacteria bacterium]|nr:transposase [Gammaproteobacteria bacterium]